MTIKQAENNHTYGSGKCYSHSVGLSVAFRQWMATSHCSYLHGYAMQVELEFSAATLNDKNWVVDFGSLKPIKSYLETLLDHRTLVAGDDPYKAWYEQGRDLGVLDLLVIEATGCECLARTIFDHVRDWMHNKDLYPRVQLDRVTVREHAGNSAWYGRDKS